MSDLYESTDKMVSHPSHYMHGGIETIDIIEAWTDSLNGIEAVDTANVIKYISRWKDKNGIQDLEKAQWYLSHLIKHLKDEEAKEPKYITHYERELYFDDQTKTVDTRKGNTYEA